MKKALFTLALSLVALCATAQPAKHVRQDGQHINRINRINAVEQLAKGHRPYKLTKMYTDDLYNIQWFCYDESDRLAAVIDSLNAQADSYYVIDSCHYNAKGQLERLAGWQRLNGRLKNVYYIDYTYDEAGNLASRSNYNNFQDEWNLGGVYNYSYNADNQITKRTLIMMRMVMQEVDYEYRDGKLYKETWFSYDFDNENLYPSEVIWFRYNDRGLLVRENDSTSNDGVHWDFFGKRTYLYDPSGNCTEYEYVDYTGSVADRSEYHYDYNIYLCNVTMPWSPELERPKTYNNAHALASESWWTVDVEHNLQYVCQYLYEYNDELVSIDQAAGAKLGVSPNPANGRVAIEGLDETPVNVQLVDAMGRQVMSTKLSASANTIDVSPLAPGVYILNAAGRTTKLLVK